MTSIAARMDMRLKGYTFPNMPEDRFQVTMENFRMAQIVNEAAVEWDDLTTELVLACHKNSTTADV